MSETLRTQHANPVLDSQILRALQDNTRLDYDKLRTVTNAIMPLVDAALSAARQEGREEASREGFCSCDPIGDGFDTFALDCGIGRHRAVARVARAVWEPASDGAA